MNWFHAGWKELASLFVDDGALATQIALLVLAVGVAVKLLGVPALWAAIALVPGCVAILGASVKRAKPK